MAEAAADPKVGVVIRTVINSLTFDGATTDPMQAAVRDALISFMAATAQAQGEATKEAQKAGIAHAREMEPASYRGRKPEFTREQFETVRDMLGTGATAAAVVKATGLSRQSVYRLRNDPVRAERVLPHGTMRGPDRGPAVVCCRGSAGPRGAGRLNRAGHTLACAAKRVEG